MSANANYFLFDVTVVLLTVPAENALSAPCPLPHSTSFCTVSRFRTPPANNRQTNTDTPVQLLRQNNICNSHILCNKELNYHTGMSHWCSSSATTSFSSCGSTSHPFLSTGSQNSHANANVYLWQQSGMLVVKQQEPGEVYFCTDLDSLPGRAGWQTAHWCNAE